MHFAFRPPDGYNVRPRNESSGTERESLVDRIQFSCPGCGVTLAVAAAHRGKTAACPKCKHQSRVPEGEVAAAPSPPPPPPAPAPAPEQQIRFPCFLCREQVRVSAKFAGRTVDCPECGKRTLVPELDEIGTFGLAGEKRPASDDEPADERPVGEWWPDGAKLNLPVSWRAPLATARQYAESEQWTKAVGLLNAVYQKSLDGTGGAGAPAVRKPLAFCLGRWAIRELERFEEGGEKPSKPIRRVLKLASERLRFGGSFGTTACPLCDQRLDHLVGTTQIRTKAGSAYVCCAAPTRSDMALVAEVGSIHKKLFVATSLDPENAEITAALARLPDWFRAVDLGPTGWTKRIVDTSGGGDDGVGGEVAGEIAGHLAVRMIAGLLSG